jgi:hypothetical protein
MDTQKQDGQARSTLATGSALEAFGREVFAEVAERCASENMGEYDERLMEIAEKHGLARRIPYDPTIHENIDAEEGGLIWSWGKPNNGDHADRSK